MFNVTVCDEFTAWFASLGAETAESVTSAVDVLAELGPALGPPRVSKMLLWYDGMKEWDHRDLVGWSALHESTRQVIVQLYKPSFLAGLEALARDSGSEAVRAVERIKTLLRTTRLLSLGRPNPIDLEKTRRALDDALAALGIKRDEMAGERAGLRELVLSSGECKMRVLFGIDPSREYILVILGEWLERNYYGDSVKLAERRWREYLSRVDVADVAPRR
jgi:hypothetical protein